MKTIRLLLLLGAALAMLSAKAQNLTFTLQDKASPPGSTVTIPVTVENFTDILGFDGTFTWDETVLTYDSYSDLAAGILTENGNIPGQLSFNWIASAPLGEILPDDTVLFNLVFNVVGNLNDTSPIDLAISNLFQWDGTAPVPINANTNNGTLWVTTPTTFKVEDYTAYNGDTITIDIRADNYIGITAVNLLFKWESTILSFVSATLGADLEPPSLGGSPFIETNVANGELKFLYLRSTANPDTFPNNTIIYSLTFEVVGNICEETPLGFDVSLPGSGVLTVASPYNEVPVNTESGTLTILEEIEVTSNSAGICPNSTIKLEAPAGFASYIWSNGETTSFAEVSNVDTYSLTVTSNQGCSSTASYEVVALSPPVVDLGEDQVICPGNNAALQAGDGTDDYLWSTGATTPFLLTTTEGIYTVTVTDENGCQGTDEASIIEKPDKDIYIQDQTSDDGTEPNNTYPVWASPGIKVTWTRGEQTTQLYGPTADAEFASINHDIVLADRPSTVYVLLKNRGCNSFGESCKVIAYWKKASSNGDWPNDWNTIGEATLSEDVLVGENAMIAIPWRVIPNPTAQVGDNTFHTCILVRWVCADDPMYNEPNGPTMTNAENNNNIGWRNVNIANEFNNAIPFEVSNDSDIARNMRIAAKQEQEEHPFSENQNIFFLEPDEDLMAAINNGGILDNFVIEGERLRMTSDDSASIFLPLVPPNTVFGGTELFESPNPYDANLEDSSYRFPISVFLDDVQSGGFDSYYARGNQLEPSIAPSNLVATPLSPFNIELSWVDNSTDEFGFVLEKIDTDNDSIFRYFYDVLPENSTQSIDTTVQPNTLYCYRIAATNAQGTNTYADTTCILTPGQNFDGIITSTNGQQMSQVEVSINDQNAILATTQSATDGSYSLPNNFGIGTYTLEAQRGNLIDQNGFSDFYKYVTIGDASKLYDHLSNSTQYPFTKEDSIAANVDLNGYLGLSDVAQIFDIASQKITAYTSNEAWVFYEEGRLPADPLNFTGTITVSSANLTNNTNFTGILLGDVNANFNGPRLAYAGELAIGHKDQTVQKGQIIEIPIYAQGQHTMKGWQYTHQWNRNVLEFIEVQSDNLAISPSDNFGYRFIDQGQLTTAWLAMGNNVIIDQEQVLYTLKFKVIGQGGMETTIATVSKPTRKLAFDDQMQAIDIQSMESKITVQKTEGQSTPTAFQLYPNTPNPFDGSTTIPFYLPKQTNVQIKLFNQNGQTIWQAEYNLDAGYQEIQWKRQKNLAAGIYYYQVTAGEATKTRKMIIH